MSTTLLLAVATAMAFPLLLLPGTALSLALRRRSGWVDHEPLSSVLIASGCVHLTSFFLWYLSPRLGTMFTWVVLLLAAQTVVRRDARAVVRRWWRDVDVGLPLLFSVAVAVAVMGSLLLHGGTEKPGETAEHRYMHQMPPDNVLPEILAYRVINHVPVEPFLGDVWKSSDRPPLQTGAVTFLEPVRVFTNFRQWYQAISTALAALAMAGTWLFLRRLKLTVASTSIAMLALAGAGETVKNTAYVWPKLLSAAFALVSMRLMIRTDSSGTDEVGADGAGPVRDRWNWVACGLAIGLSLLAHGASFYVYLPIVLYLGLRWLVSVGRTRRLGLRSLVTGPFGIAAFVAIVSNLPWMAYQRIVAPPGDRLLAWHIGGVIDPKPAWYGPDLPWYRVVIRSYRETGLRGAWRNHVENFRVLVNAKPLLRELWPFGDPIVIRGHEFFAMTNAMGLSIVGLLLLPAALLWKGSRDRHETIVCATVLAFTAWGLFWWCVVSFGPGSTIPHSGSTVFQILLTVAPVLVVVALNARLGLALAVLSFARGIVLWYFASDTVLKDVSKVAVVITVLGLAGVVALVWRSQRSTEHR